MSVYKVVIRQWEVTKPHSFFDRGEFGRIMQITPGEGPGYYATEPRDARLQAAGAEKFLNRMSEEGWELVSAVGSDGVVSYIFRR